jgi:chemotaxis family two-component system sensor kinase Cph1
MTEATKAARSDENPVTAGNVDLSDCDRELIQYSGAIQPHGVMLVLHEPELRVLQASANAAAVFGLPMEKLLASHAEALLGTTNTEQLRKRLGPTKLDGAPVHLLRLDMGAKQRFHVFGHRIDGVLILELEMAGDSAAETLDLYSELRMAISRLQATANLDDFLNLAVEQVREFTGFDRVMAYRFLEDGSGDVTAESLKPGLESYLGLRYPASDIPQPARRLFSLNWLRHLPDVCYEPIPIVPATNPLTNGPLDLSYAFTRSLSVMYTDYLKNMGVKSTLVITLLKKGELWGLISCMNHERPVHVQYETRMACEFLGHMISLLMDSKEDIGNYRHKLKLAAVLDQISENMNREKDFRDGLTKHEPSILTNMDSGGAAVVAQGEVRLLGTTPTTEQILKLATWVATQSETVFSTDRLAAIYPPAEAFQGSAAGVMGIRLRRNEVDMILWFRPELPQTVSWAGNPEKPVEVLIEGDSVRLTPRRSFELWKQSVSGRSAVWESWELAAAGDLRRKIVEVVLQRAEELSLLNRQLEQSNMELDSFAYTAAHDLKEPLRGINSFAGLLGSDSARLEPRSRKHLETIQTLSRRMDGLIDSLLEYSKVGNLELQLVPVDLNTVVERVLQTTKARLDEAMIALRLPRPLPTASCDAQLVEEVLQNLITNAAKYNDKAERWIEIGYQEQNPVIYFVRDNGIGIDRRHAEQVFQIFRRLHGRHEFGGGSGAGLTITRRMIQRHGGRIWFESTPGEGSTFYFTLGPETRER